MANQSTSPRLRGSSSLEVKNLVISELSKLEVGEISAEDTDLLVGELEDSREIVEKGPSFISILLGDLLTFTIFTTVLYLLIIQLMNNSTGSIIG